jgi:phosphoribosyl 1,2-cyclic phosphodiesterase
VAYRIEFAGKAACYVTDTEHVPRRRDRTILDLIAGADVVVYDATYTDGEYDRFRGWGHSTWEEGVRLCEAAGAGRLVAFHHDPDHDDATLDAIAAALERRRPGSLVAYEGLVIAL